MDARLIPSRALGLEEGDAHVIRNAGGLARDALRSLVISQQLLGTREIVVIHHTDCGMLTFTNEQLQAKVRTELGADASAIDFQPFEDLEQSVADDVAFLRESPLLLEGVLGPGLRVRRAQRPDHRGGGPCGRSRSVMRAECTP